MRVSLFALLGAAGALLSALPTLGYVASRRSTDLLPVEYDNEVFNRVLTASPFVGKVVSGPFIREGRKGNIYVSGSVVQTGSPDSKCFYGSLNAKGNWLRTGIIDPTGDFLPQGACTIYGMVRGFDGSTYHVGIRNGIPFVAKLTNDMSEVDYDFLVLHRDTLSTLLRGQSIIGASIALNQRTGEVYTAWILDGQTTKSWIIKYSPTTSGISVFAPPIGKTYAKATGIYVLPNGVVMVAGVTLDRLDRSGQPALSGLSLFALWYTDPRDGYAGVITSEKVWVSSGPQVKDVSLSVDDDDFSVYFACTLDNASSQLLKLSPVIPKVDVNLPLKQMAIPGKLTSPATNFPESFSYVATSIGGSIGNVIYVTDNALSTKSVIKLPPAAAGEVFVNIAASRTDLGTIIVASFDSAGRIILRKIGNKQSRVRIYHRKTGLTITMTLDSRISLLPLDTTTKNQQFDRHPMTKTFRNVQLNLAVTTRGRPFPFSTYEQEKGFKIVGEPYSHPNRRQRWAYANGRLVSLLDKKCLSLDRNYLVNGRWPRTFTALPLITVPCSTDKMQVFDVVHAQ
ncbi:hypothetical protein HDU67_007708 [Dinochytrium kinnereticum]|nr:hypothetical protein HDU67_007708 [Dinochytrium kinnereticum]